MITMNDHGRANCLSLPMLKELRAKLSEIKACKNIGVLIITGEGRFFSTGHDLQELHTGTESEHEEIISTCYELVYDISKLPVPSIAAVNGPAVAAGCQLVAACDLAISIKSAYYALPGIKIGLFCSTPAVQVIRAIGLRAAKELLFTGRPIDAQRAYELGLVHRIVPDDQLMPEAIKFAQEITQHNFDVVTLGREALIEQATMRLTDAYQHTSKVMVRNLQLEDTQNRIGAFLDKKSSGTK